MPGINSKVRIDIESNGDIVNACRQACDILKYLHDHPADLRWRHSSQWGVYIDGFLSNGLGHTPEEIMASYIASKGKT